MTDSQLFEDNFTITSINAQKYDRVSRITANSIDGATTLSLDVNTELYPLSTGDAFNLVLATTLNLDGTKDDRAWRDLSKSAEHTLADMYDYVCRGKLYRFEEAPGGETLRVYVSFGGLLLYLDGPFKKLTGLRLDYLYLLMKK